MGRFPGTTETMILLAAVRLGDDAYGAAILDEIETASGWAPSSGSLSTALDRMERKSLIRSTYPDGDASRAGRARRVVVVTPAGRALLEETAEALRRLGVPGVADRALDPGRA